MLFLTGNFSYSNSQVKKPSKSLLAVLSRIVIQCMLSSHSSAVITNVYCKIIFENIINIQVNIVGWISCPLRQRVYKGFN
jgi:hypothetical protein